MNENEKYEIVILAEDYERKRQSFECQQMLNTYGKSPEELMKMSINYHLAEADMIEAKNRLDKAKWALGFSRSP